MCETKCEETIVLYCKKQYFIVQKPYLSQCYILKAVYHVVGNIFRTGDLKVGVGGSPHDDS